PLPTCPLAEPALASIAAIFAPTENSAAKAVDRAPCCRWSRARTGWPNRPRGDSDASSYQSSGRREPRRTLLEEPEDDPGEVTLEGPDRLLPGVALGDLAGDERAGRGEPPGLGEGKYVKRPVELAVAAPFEAHPVHLARARRD